MKTAFTRLLCAISLLGLLFWANTVTAQVVFEKTLHDFGEITEGDIKSYTFKYRNTLQNPVTLTSVRASCGCTTPQYTKAAVPGGGNGEIKVSFNSKGRPGKFTKSITVRHDGGSRPITLTIKGNVRPNPNLTNVNYRDTIGALAIENKKLNFGSVASDDVKAMTLYVRNVGKSAITLQKQLVDVPAYYSYEPKLFTLKPQQETQVSFKVDGTVMKENDLQNHTPFNDKLYFRTDESQDALKYVKVSGKFSRKYTPEERKQLPHIAFEEEDFDAGTILSGEKLKHSFKFKNRGGQPLKLKRVKASCGCTATAPSQDVIQPGESAFIEATFDSKGRSGKQHKTIMVQSNDPVNPNVVLHLRVTVDRDPFGSGGAPMNPGGGGF